MGWSAVEDLLCLADDGSVSVYDIHGTFKKTFSMGQVCMAVLYVTKKYLSGATQGHFTPILCIPQEAKESRVIDCRIFSHPGGTGMAILTGSYNFYVTNNVDVKDVRSRRLVKPPGM